MAFFLRKEEKKIAAIFHFLFFFGLVNDIVNQEGNHNSIKRRKANRYISLRKCNDVLVHSVVVNVDIVTQSV